MASFQSSHRKGFPFGVVPDASVELLLVDLLGRHAVGGRLALPTGWSDICQGPFQEFAGAASQRGKAFKAGLSEPVR
ncbi:hypothetical protein ACWD5Q_35000 [Streptomyces sp. NPDC002513]